MIHMSDDERVAEATAVRKKLEEMEITIADDGIVSGLADENAEFFFNEILRDVDTRFLYSLGMYLGNDGGFGCMHQRLLGLYLLTEDVVFDGLERWVIITMLVNAVIEPEMSSEMQEVIMACLLAAKGAGLHLMVESGEISRAQAIACYQNDTPIPTREGENN